MAAHHQTQMNTLSSQSPESPESRFPNQVRKVHTPFRGWTPDGPTPEARQSGNSTECHRASAGDQRAAEAPSPQPVKKATEVSPGRPKPVDRAHWSAVASIVRGAAATAEALACEFRDNH